MDPITKNIDFISLLGFAFCAIACFLAVFFLLKSRLKSNYLWLYLILLLLSTELAYKTLIHSRAIVDYPFYFVPHHYYNLLLYPLFLGFVWQIIGKWQQRRLVFWLGFLTIGLYELFEVIQWLSVSIIEKQQMIRLFYEDRRPGPFNYWRNWETLIKGVLIPLAFLISISFIFIQFNRKSTKKTDRLLLGLMTSVIGLYFFYAQMANWIYQKIYHWSQYSMIEWPTDIIFLSIITLLLSIITLLVNTGTSLFPAPKYARSALDENQAQVLFQKAHALLQTRKHYLDAGLNIKHLSQDLATNEKYLSQAINQILGISFTQWINTFRVEEAKVQLLQTSNQHLTLEAIGQQCGFRSKSSFFNAFKKMTGLTPNTYIKSQDSEF